MHEEEGLSLEGEIDFQNGAHESQKRQEARSVLLEPRTSDKSKEIME